MKNIFMSTYFFFIKTWFYVVYNTILIKKKVIDRGTHNKTFRYVCVNIICLLGWKTYFTTNRNRILLNWISNRIT